MIVFPIHDTLCSVHFTYMISCSHFCSNIENIYNLGEDKETVLLEYIVLYSCTDKNMIADTDHAWTNDWYNLSLIIIIL